MHRVFRTAFHTASIQNYTRTKSSQRFISSSTFTSIFQKTGSHLALNKEKQESKKSSITENFSTGRKWNPFYVRKSCYDRILAVEGNRHCPDCSSTDVHFISTINGGLYCPVCAGIHRELGTHPDFLPLSNDIKVSNEDMQFYESMGNYNVNNIYEAALDVTGTNKPTNTSSRCEISDYIQKKYLDCSFSISRHDRPSTENVLHFVSNMRLRGIQIPDLREKVNNRIGTTYNDVMNEAFTSPYLVQVNK